MRKSTNKTFGVDTTNFLATFFVVLMLSFGIWSFAGAIGGSSDPLNSSSNVNSQDDNDNREEEISLSLPQRIVISKIGVDQPILNPVGRDPKILDENLLSGVVRYPDSGYLGEKKNIFLFGHSTGFRTVQNQAFKAFNDLGDLTPGDEIVVMSAEDTYIYRVTSSKQVSAEDALVEFNSENKLILSTCNTFGRKEDRFIVEADFIKSYKLSNN